MNRIPYTLLTPEQRALVIRINACELAGFDQLARALTSLLLKQLLP